jgi:hypothetical protein
MFIAALFMIAKLWNQPRCPTTKEWINQMWYIYTKEYYSSIKKKLFLRKINVTGDQVKQDKPGPESQILLVLLICGL